MLKVGNKCYLICLRKSNCGSLGEIFGKMFAALLQLARKHMLPLCRWFMDANMSADLKGKIMEKYLQQ